MQSHNDGASRLFLSADLVGSTARKQTHLDGWLDDVLGFYQQFPGLVEEKVAETCADYPVDLEGEPPVLDLWKAVGDELVFSCVIRDEHHVRLVVKSFVAALGAWSERVLSGKAKLPLKGAAWIATFPSPDRAIAVIARPAAVELELFDPDRAPEHNNRELLAAIEADRHPELLWLDFIGPGMDTGFRVASKATPRRFMLSLEAAWLYAEAAGAADPDELYLEGEIEMKGVWGGRGYPLFWLDTKHQHAGQPVLDRLLQTVPASASDVCELARSLSNGNDDWVTKIYVPGTKKVALRHHHDAVEDEVRRLAEVTDAQADPLEL